MKNPHGASDLANGARMAPACKPGSVNVVRTHGPSDAGRSFLSAHRHQCAPAAYPRLDAV